MLSRLRTFKWTHSCGTLMTSWCEQREQYLPFIPPPRILVLEQQLKVVARQQRSGDMMGNFPFSAKYLCEVEAQVHVRHAFYNSWLQEWLSHPRTWTLLYDVFSKVMKSYGKQQGRNQSQCEEIPTACRRWLHWIIELSVRHKLTSSWVKFKIKRRSFYSAQ